MAAAEAIGSPADHFLDYSEDNFKVQFISGNLTASVTRDWPRVDFQHSANLLSPMFEIGMNRMFLFNDTNGDGVFSRSEAIYTSFLDSSHVKWNVSDVEFVTQPEYGAELATFSMSTTVSLYSGYADQTADTPVVPDWANATFSFAISDVPITFTNSFGQYVVAGRTALRMQMTIDVLAHVSVSGLALEQALQAGGSVYLFLLSERATKSNATVVNAVSARVDESGRGLNFTHRFQQTTMPTQNISFAKDDGTVQAYYHYSSEPTCDVHGAPVPVIVNSSYYTTGTGLMMYLGYSFDNRTDSLTHDMSVGLDMSGFVRVRDWAAQNLPVLAIICGGLVALTVTSVHLWRRKRRRMLENGEDMKRGAENQSGPK